MIRRKYNYFYKITNNINGFYYYGVHSTDNLDDGYMGSGTKLKLAYKEFGIENFSKEILKFFDTKEEAFEYEASVVTEQLVLSEKCYNQKIGGGESTMGMLCVIDKHGNKLFVYRDDPRYLSGELVSIEKGKVVVSDKEGNTYKTNMDDPRYLSGELVGMNKGMVTVKDGCGNTFIVSVDDPRYLSGELLHIAKNMVTVKDKSGNFFMVSVDDPRYLSGELVFVYKNRKHTEETKRKIGIANSVKQKGKRNSHYGMCWIKNDNLKLNKSIKRCDLDKYLSDGWSVGRNMKYKKE